jgi:hypothetical protein
MDAALCRRVAEEYLKPTMPLYPDLVRMFGISTHTVRAMLHQELSEGRRRLEHGKRLAVTKLGVGNPMFGRYEAQHHNYKGECEDGYGYLTQKVGRKRHFMHRIVMSKMLGISVEALPTSLIVYHLDGNPHNNDEANLCLMTDGAHMRIHSQLRELERDRVASGTSK